MISGMPAPGYRDELGFVSGRPLIAPNPALY